MKFSLRTLLLVSVLASVLAFGISAVFADLPQPDGRVNQVHHFGGDALYCVDANMNPTDQYSDFGKGGFRLLNKDGQELWFLPAAVVDEVAAQSEASNQTLLVAEGTGSYGPTSLYVFMAEEGGITFTFFGYDEHGKQNSITFKFCEPVGPAEEPFSVGEPELPEETETPTPLMCNLRLLCGRTGCEPSGYVVECSQCPEGQYVEDFMGLGPTCLSAIPLA